MEIEMIILQRGEIKHNPKTENMMMQTKCLSSFCGMHGLKCLGMHLVAGVVLGDLLSDLDQGITELLDSQKSNMVVPDGPTQGSSVGFRPGEHAGQSMVSIPLACRDCLHTPVT